MSVSSIDSANIGRHPREYFQKVTEAVKMDTQITKGDTERFLNCRNYGRYI